MSRSASRQLSATSLHGNVASDDADETAVPWWSFGKTVLAVAALRLVAQNALALDEHLPGADYTLRQLLCHRSGLGDYGMLPDYHAAVARGDAPWSETEMRERTRHLAREPAARFSYSNVGYAIVRDMIVTASGMDLQAALHALVFEPLRVRGARIVRAPAELATTAWGNALGYHPGWVYHGLLAGSAGAAARLLDGILDGERRFLPAALLAEMRTPLPVEAPPDDRPWRLSDSGSGYGLGLMIGTGEPAVRFEGHTGGGPGSRIAVYRAADTGLTACVAINIEDEAVVERAAMARAAASGGSRVNDAGSG